MATTCIAAVIEPVRADAPQAVPAEGRREARAAQPYILWIVLVLGVAAVLMTLLAGVAVIALWRRRHR